MNVGEPSPLPAGGFSHWLRAMRSALAGGPGMEVACGDCVGCCTSSYYIKIRPHEQRALERIGAQNLESEAAADGSRLMGFGANGHCHMFSDGGCSIYRDRPETCRTYDCRIYTAAGIDAGEGRDVINGRISQWQFDYPGHTDREEHRAVEAAASYLRQHPVRFPNGRIPSRPVEIAVLAVKVYEVFLDPPGTDREIVAAIIQAVRNFNRREQGGMHGPTGRLAERS
jgi:Fe-S-cluster containining protein